MKQTTHSKKQAGITLIALAVTIVVLLILAGVSLNAVFGENGILQKAQKAENIMEQAKQNDLSELEKLEEELDKYTRSEIQKNVVYREFTAKVYVGTYTKDLAVSYINTKIEICELNDTGEETGAKLIYTLGKDGTIKAKNDPKCVFNENESTINLEEGTTVQFPTINVKIAENTTCKIKVYKLVAANAETGYENEPLGEKIVTKDVTDAETVSGYAKQLGDLDADGYMTSSDTSTEKEILAGTKFPELVEFITVVDSKNVIVMTNDNGELINENLKKYICYDVNRDGKIDENDSNAINMFVTADRVI